MNTSYEQNSDGAPCCKREGAPDDAGLSGALQHLRQVNINSSSTNNNDSIAEGRTGITTACTTTNENNNTTNINDTPNNNIFHFLVVVGVQTVEKPKRVRVI